ncbi:hypothetical protein JCM19240_3378 [Vibrio maritimus]|uniref:Uncharacterized protein n=1 Tax=Vibrio maritimus TaxID=990268 RepID=A0A090T745_9VIBR|nr:hypothetical protein JCM19240_3378 [Vibrio maritimus]
MPVETVMGTFMLAMALRLLYRMNNMKGCCPVSFMVVYKA